VCKTIFFLPRDLDEDSILNQGVEVAAGDPVVIGGSSLAGGHQGSAAGSGWNLGGWGQPPTNIGHVPSHVSVTTHVTAATSVVATRGYFVGATCQSVAEINARRVICPKSACGVLGSYDYTCHQEAATKALPHVCASAKHFHAKNASSNKYANLHTAAEMTQFWAQFKQNDLQNHAIRKILAKSNRIAPQNCAELVPKLLLRILLYVDFSILIPLCSMILSIYCFIGIFVGPLNTNCIKYQANQKWAKLELSLSCGKSRTLCILCHE
jgi:hypothetical protein